ncbi:MAG TPA: MAC/perforin domain-containing protein [Solirubrobacteraceae bacterium]|jgi:hypothetical protein|nr:MAC/perforin domain-containing protein [Solirubrobacteraceae bacterium]
MVTRRGAPALAALALAAAAAVNPFAGTQAAHAAVRSADVQSVSGSTPRSVGYGYDIANSAYFNGGDVKTTPILDIGKLEAAGLIKTENRSTFDQSIDAGTNISEYSKTLSGSVGVSGGIGAFKASVKTSFGSFSSVTAETSFITNNAVVRKREYYIEGGSDFDTLKQYLTPKFEQDVNDPDVSPETLFSTYGTHLLTNVSFGGTLSMNYLYTNTSQESSNSLSVEAEASYGTISGTASVAEQQTAAKLAANSKISIKSFGGTNNINATSIDAAKASYANWDGSIKADDPASLEFVGAPSQGPALDTWTTPIWAFATDPARKLAIEKQFNDDLHANAAYFQTLQAPVTYVKNIYVAADNSSANADAKLRSLFGSNEFVTYPAPWDLNRGAGGAFVYLGYTTTTDPSQAVTDVVTTDGKNENHYEKNGVKYDSTGVDLNQQAGGDWIWLLYTHNPRAAQEPGKLIRSLGVQINGDKTSNIDVGPGWRENPLDLNRKAGGAYIYLWDQVQEPGAPL